MKNFLKIFAAFFFISLFYGSSYAHKEWVHQWIIKEAFKILKKELPEQDFSELNTFLGTDQYGAGNWADQFYPEIGNNSIVRGAYQEDMVDLVWNYANNGNKGFSPSDTHFWDGQAGSDYTHSHLSNEYIENAFEKAHRYFFGKSEFDNFTLTRGGFLVPVLNYPRGLFELHQYTLSYPSLCDVYHNASLTFKNANYGFDLIIFWINLGCVCWNIDLHSAAYPLNTTERKRFTYNILGRILHLLGDMSVPAHTHNDTHPCLVDGDEYELFMGNRYPGVSQFDCNADQNDPSNSTQFEPDIRKQGGIIWEVFSMTDVAALRYLFYNTNRLAAHFPSWSVEWGLQQNGNNSISQGTNPFLNYMYSQLGDPPGNFDSQSESMAAFRYVIRATATLLYWAEIKLQQISCPTVLRLQDDNFFGIEVPPTTKLASFEATDKIIGGNNVFVTGVPQGDYTVHSQALLQLKAGQQVSLKDGFSVNSGANFHALISNPACVTINGDNSCSPSGGGSSSAPIASSSFKQNSFPRILAVTDTSVNKLLIYTDSNATIRGTIKDTIVISQYLASLWDTTGLRGDTVKISGDVMLDTAGVYVIVADTVKILYGTNYLREEIDTNAFVEVYGNGKVLIYTDTAKSSAHSGSPIPMTVHLYPNPANKISTISYNLPYQAMVSISVFDDLGHEREIILSNQHQKSGEHTIVYDFSKLPHGIYYVRVQYSGKVKTVQLISPDK